MLVYLKLCVMQNKINISNIKSGNLFVYLVFKVSPVPRVIFVASLASETVRI